PPSCRCANAPNWATCRPRPSSPRASSCTGWQWCPTRASRAEQRHDRNPDIPAPDARRAGAARGPRHSRRQLRQPGHRHAGADRRLPAARPRDHPAQRERHPGHGAAAGAAGGRPRPHQRRQAARHPAAGRRVLPSCRFVRDDARRPPGHLRDRRHAGLGARRPGQLVAGPRRRTARGGRRHGPGGGRAARLHHDGAQLERRLAQDRRALHPAAHRRRRGQPRVHRPGRHRRHARRPGGSRYDRRPDPGNAAVAHRRAAARRLMRNPPPPPDYAAPLPADEHPDRFRGDPDFMLTLSRGLRVIRAFGERRYPQTAADLSRRAGLPRAVTQRCLHTLIRLGFAERHGRHYVLTPLILSLGHAYFSSTPFVSLAQPVLEELSATVNETCALAILEGNEVLYLARSEVHRILATTLGLGSRLPAYCTTIGRVMLAQLPPAALDRYFDTVELAPYTEFTETSPARLREIIAR